MRAWDARVTAEHGPEALWLACSHGDVIKAIVADALGVHLDLFQRIVVDPASVTVDPVHPDAAVPGAAQRHRRRPGRAGAAAAQAAPAAGAGGRVGRGGRRRRGAAGEPAPCAARPASGRIRRRRAARRSTRPDRVVGMTHQVHAFEPPERFVAGTVGAPGERTFFLQARGGGRLVSVALEKVQVSLLAEKLEELLAEAQRRFGVDAAGGAGRRRRQRAAGHPGRRGVPGRHARAGLRRATPPPW